ncbi:sel1 repeat family protein [Escherichia coli]|uniref:tetratricopeptide repeat protein n=1 Tax=Escherichia sp. MOD1-EC4550 TaxID=2093861 RepID=UPI000CF79989|nr:tetratricopeptide repeat protein [Escherichia sp. MOD1-EC4550]EGO8684095.1 sel1 repeat family protein [Escherichia coli]EGO8720966.1 sel1 repeat family protein [Escherichia coli]MCS1345926.1 sel1 repeat family protein [Escherichia coli]HAW4048209.1 sel1 repeat family protein [Escherichia coli]
MDIRLLATLWLWNISPRLVVIVTTIAFSSCSWARLTPCNSKSDFVCLQLRAQQGKSSDQYDLAWIYLKGDGVTPKDDKKALYWFRKAAENGMAGAQYRLGRRYYSGDGVTKNYKEAFNWFMKASGRENSWGIAAARYMVGVMYYRGQGVEKNYTHSFSWFMKSLNGAGREKASRACYFIGSQYLSGHGITQNNDIAIAWFYHAAKLGLPEAIEYISGIEKKFSAEMLKPARIEANRINAKHYLGQIPFPELLAESEAEVVVKGAK